MLLWWQPVNAEDFKLHHRKEHRNVHYILCAQTSDLQKSVKTVHPTIHASIHAIPVIKLIHNSSSIHKKAGSFCLSTSPGGRVAPAPLGRAMPSMLKEGDVQFVHEQMIYSVSDLDVFCFSKLMVQ